MNTPVKLLYLEDDAVDYRAFLRMARQKDLPYEIATAKNLAEARSLLAQFSFDVIVADYHLPDGNCTELFNEVPDTPFILITGTLEEQLALRTLQRGADDYLPKDTQQRHLQALPFTIEKTLYRHRLREAEKRLTKQLHEREEALRESEERFRLFMDNSPAIAWIKDDQGRHVYLSKTYEECFGVRLADWQGKTDAELWPPEVADQFRKNDRLVLEGRQAIKITEETVNPDGSRSYWYNSKFPFCNRAGQWFVAGIGINITDLKQLETRLVKAKEAAEAASRAKSQFLASMSHELRTPMNAILGMTELALNRPLSPDIRDFLQTAKESADQLLELLNEILDFSRIEAGRFEMEYKVFNLPETIEQVVKTLGIRAYEKGLELVCDLSEDLPRCIRGDALRLRQVLNNLVGNAIKFTHKGEIVIRAEKEAEETEKVRLRFTVSDTGIGISPEHLEKIFDPFTQADASTTRHYGGSGLGLAIVKRLVMLMGGSIGVQSEVGHGSTFSFTVVLPKCQEVVDEPIMEPSLIEFLRGVSVLIVADSATQRRVLKEHFSSWSMLPEETPDVPSALAKIHQANASGRKYSLVLADAVMPTINGFTLADWLRHDDKLAGPVILMLSAEDRQNYLDQCRGADWICLDKPVTHSVLFSAVMKALGRDQELLRHQSAAVKLSPPPHPVRCLRILLAEDSPGNQKLLLHVLGERGHSVQIAQDGLQALKLLEQQDFDLVLMDVQMPEMDGFEATRKIRLLTDPRKARVPIIALTAHALKGDQERCLAAGMTAYLSKPIKAEEMIQMVEQLATADLAGRPLGTGS